MYKWFGEKKGRQAKGVLISNDGEKKPQQKPTNQIRREQSVEKMKGENGSKEDGGCMWLVTFDTLWNYSVPLQEWQGTYSG